MKQLIENLIKNSISSLDKDGSVNPNLVANIRVDRTKDRAHGDFATNIAMILAKPLKKNPRQIAEDIIASLPKDDHISKVEIDLTHAHIWDITSVNMLNNVVQKFKAQNIEVNIIGLNEASSTLVDRYSSN